MSFNNLCKYMNANELIHLSGFRSFQLRDTKNINNSDPMLVYSDLLRNLPIFVFAYEKAICKEYIFNLFAYLKYKSYPVFWYENNIPTEFLNRQVLIVPFKEKHNYTKTLDIIAYPGIEGKKTLWKQINKYVSQIISLNIAPKSINSPCFIINNPESCKDLYNVAGFFDYMNISYSWNIKDATQKTVIIGQKSDNNKFIEIVEGNSEVVKKHIFEELIKNKYLKISNNKDFFEIGEYFHEKFN
ncbi:MAG: hypothetical protein ACI4V7_03550 [Succinivibrionaceae bacterium]